MIQIGKTMILNEEDRESLSALPLNGLYPLTCGLSTRSTVTASSIREDGFTYCLQRSIYSLSGREIPPQEFSVHWHHKPAELYPCLETITLLLLCEIPRDFFELLRF